MLCARAVVVAARNSITYKSINYLQRELVRTGATVAFMREVCCEREIQGCTRRTGQRTTGCYHSS